MPISPQTSSPQSAARSALPSVEPSAEPSAQSSVEPSVQSCVESSVESAGESAAEPTVHLPRVPEPRPEHELAAVRGRIAADPALAGLAPDAHLHTEHSTGMVFAHGRRLTVVEVLQDVDDAAVSAVLARRDGLAGRRNAAVVVARRMTVAAARRSQHAGVRFVSLVDLTS